MKPAVVLCGALLAAALPACAEEPSAGRERTPAWELSAEEAPPLRQWGRLGPFEVRDPYPLAQLRHAPWARSPRTLGHLQWEAAVRAVWANSYGFRSGRAVVDAETRTLNLSLRLGLFDRLEFGLLVPYEWRGGGILDGFIEGFHELFGLPEQNRDRRKRDRYLVAGSEPDGSASRLDHQGDGLGDLTLEARGLLSRGGPLLPAAALTLRLRLPSARPGFQFADGVDASLALDLSKRIAASPVVLYASLAYTYYADAEVVGLRLMRHRLFFAAGFEWEIDAHISLVAHAWVESRRERALWDDANVPGIGNLSYGNYVSYVAAGFKFAPTKGLAIELGILENLLDPDVTADLGWLLNASWRF